MFHLLLIKFSLYVSKPHKTFIIINFISTLKCKRDQIKLIIIVMTVSMDCHLKEALRGVITVTRLSFEPAHYYQLFKLIRLIEFT